MAKAFGVSCFVLDSGERDCLVVDRVTGLPLYYPNLYLTTQLRNRSLAFETVRASARHLVVLLRFLDRRGIDLEARMLAKQFFRDFELDALSDFAQRKQRKLPAEATNDSVFTLEELEESTETVVDGTHYVRLTEMANYIGWLARHLLERATKDVVEDINEMCVQLRERRPTNRGRNINRLERSLSDQQIDVLFEVMRPGSPVNPFSKGLQRRNRLMILLLFHLGIRRGELLNIRIRDIDFSKNQIRVVRRADEKDDPREDEPNAKTLSRLVPLGDLLAKELHDYITQDRRKVGNANRNDFLIVTHKAGPTQGQPLSKPGYHKFIGVVRGVAPDFYAMLGHMLRHTWNRRFSEKMDSMDEPPSEARQEQIRSSVMGWREGSGTAATYNSRFVEKKGYEASLDMQKSSGTRVPRNLTSDH